ncbi:AAA domain-containing protein, partial [Lactifluus subvellereus]
LFKNLCIHQVFGANTDVGKTILTSGLVRASAAKKNKVFYLKPVSTGPIQHADDEHVRRHAGPHKDLVTARWVYRFDEPVSPHLAHQSFRESLRRPDPIIINSRSHPTALLGVHSPTLSGTTQLDSYRPLFLPSILVGDLRLGNISSTISAYESLLLRGCIVDSTLLFKDVNFWNISGLILQSMEHPPLREMDPSRNVLATEGHYHQLSSDNDAGLLGVLEHLDERHEERIRELHSMARGRLDTV